MKLIQAGRNKSAYHEKTLLLHWGWRRHHCAWSWFWCTQPCLNSKIISVLISRFDSQVCLLVLWGVPGNEGPLVLTRMRTQITYDAKSKIYSQLPEAVGKQNYSLHPGLENPSTNMFISFWMGIYKGWGHILVDYFYISSSGSESCMLMNYRKQENQTLTPF